MAYELANAIASGSAAQDVAGSSNGQASGGRFSPNGSKIAVTTTRQGGAGSTDQGVDFYVSSSADGWHLNASLDSDSGNAIRQIVWYDTDTVFVVEGNTTVVQYNSGSSGGWAHQRLSANVGFTVMDIVFNPSKTRALVYGATAKLYAYTVSDSGAWSLEKNFSQVGHKPNANINDVSWIDNDTFVVGEPTANTNRGELQVYHYNGSWSKTEQVAGSATTINHYYLGDSVTWHASSSTIIAGATIGAGGSTTEGGLLMIPSSSGYGFLPASNPGWHGYQVNTDSLSTNNSGQPRRALPYGLGIRQDPENDNAFLGGFQSQTGSPFDDGVIYTLESGSSEGWRVTQLYNDHAHHVASVNFNIDLYDGTAVTNNNILYNADATFKVWAIAEYNPPDNTGPSVSSVAITSATNAQNSTLNEGDVVSVTVTMDEATVVNTTGGTPYITLSVGGVSRNASYASGTGTTALIFQYTIASSETTDSDGISIGSNAIALNSGTMQDAAGNNATITHSAVSANSSFKVDTTKPTISSLSVAANNSTVTVTFAEAVYAGSNGTGDLVAADFTLGLSGGNQANISLNATPSGISKTSQSIWVLTLNGTDLDSIALGTETLSVDAANNTSIYDLAGNAHTAAASTVSLNNTADIDDTVTSTIGSSGGTVKAGNTTVSPDVTVTIPSDALSGNVSIGASVATAFDPKTAGVTQAGGAVGESLSAVIRLTPHGQAFDQAVTVQFKLEGSAAGSCPTNLEIWKRNSATGVWYQLPSDLWSCSSGTVSISTTSFSDFAALGGNNMARTKINNVQLARLAESNKVLPEAINITGSAESLVTSVNDSDVFILQQAGALAKHVSGSVLKSYFAGGGVDVTASAVNENYRLTFVDHQDTSQIGLAVDSDLLYNPSTNTLTATKLSSTNVDGILGANSAAAATVTTLSATGDVDLGNATSDTITATARFDSDLVPSTDSARDLGTSALQWAEAHIDAGYIDAITVTGTSTLTTVDINGGNIDGTAIGAASHSTGKFTTVDATTDFTIDGLVITADTITNDAALEVASTGLTLNASLDIALSADGGNVTMDDGTTTVFDFNVDDPALKIMDDAQVTNYLSLAVGANGATTIETVDADAAAANLQITADGTVDIDSAGLMTLDSGGAINLEPAAGSAILLDGTISVDAGVVTGATSITSTAFVGAIDGALGGNTPAAATVTTLSATGDVDLGDATGDTITATGRFDSDLVPSTDSARDLGTSALQWAEAHIDTGNIDTVVATAITASAIRVTELDVVTINSINQTEATLEIEDKLIVSAVSASSANADGGGLRIGGADNQAAGHASVLWNHASSSMHLNVGGEVQIQIKDGALLPGKDDNVDIGSATDTLQFKDLYLDGTANADALALNSGATVTAILDEDAMGSDSATALATQQSIKAYVDANGGNFYLEDDDGTEVQITNSKEMKFIGSGITTNWTDTSDGSDGDPYDLTFTVDAAQTGITSILNSSLKLGYGASDAYILFSTDNEINFAIDNTTQVVVDDGTFHPETDSDVDLGTTAKRFKTGYIDDITVTNHVTASSLISTGDVHVGANGHLETTDGGNDHSIFPTMTGPGQTLTLGGGSAISTAGSFSAAAATVTSLSVSDGNITNVGDINADSISVDGAATGLNIDGSGADTTKFKVTMADNLADALNINEGGNSYLKFVTTNGSEQVVFGKNSTFASTTIADLGTVTTADINGGTIDGVTLGSTNTINVTAIDLDGATALGGASMAQADLLLIDDGAGGTMKSVTFSNFEDSIFGNVSGDATVAAGGALTIAATAVEGSMLNNNIVSGLDDINAAIAATDEMIISDAGTIKRTDVSRLGTFLGGGDGLQVTSGVLSITPVEDICSSASKNSILSNDLVTASLTQDMVSGSLQVFLNGMLQTPSGSVQGGSDHTAIYDYLLITSSHDGEAFAGKPKVWFAQAIDSDDVIQLRYIKK